MTVANIITILRIALIPVILLLLFSGPKLAPFVLLLLFLIGDLVDGAIARWREEVTDLGKFLDPLADKLLAASLLISLAALGDLPWLAFVLLAVQQLGLIGGTLLLARKKGPILGARGLGKAAATVLNFGIALTLFKLTFFKPQTCQEISYVAIAIIYAGIALSYPAGIDYLRAAFKESRA